MGAPGGLLESGGGRWARVFGLKGLFYDENSCFFDRFWLGEVQKWGWANAKMGVGKWHLPTWVLVFAHSCSQHAGVAGG